MAAFNFEDRLRLALREAAERELQRGRTDRTVAKARRAFQTTRRSFAPAAAAGLATALALVVVVVFLTRAGSDREAVHPPEVVARLALADSLGGAVGAHGSVWLADTSGDRLLRVDPKSREVIARIPVEDDLAMAPVGEMLWVVSQSSSLTPRDFRSRLLRVDPGSNAVAARLPLRMPSGEPFAGFDVVADRESLWVLGTTETWHNKDQLGVMRVDAQTGRVTAAFPLPVGWGRVGIALRADGLWAITADQRLLRFDPRTGERLSEARLDLPPDDREPAPGQLRFAGETLITSTRGGLAGVDPYAGRVVWRRQLGQSVPAWTEADGLIWAVVSPHGSDRLVAVDPGDGHVATSVGLDAFGSASIASVRDELWITTVAGEALVLRR
jgi:streptogramin lyase